MNNRNEDKSSFTFDLSAFYTKVTYEKILTVLDKLTDFSFNVGRYNFIHISKFAAHLSKQPSDHKTCFNKQKILSTYFNYFFIVDLKIFCQIIGVHMGSDPTPFFANLFL